MIFSELYSAYYSAVSAVIGKLINGERREKELKRTVEKFAFAESAMSILPSLKSAKWQLMKPDFTTNLKHTPTLPLTDIQKRWLKAVSLDKRIKLFDVTFTGLEDVEPLFTEEDYVIYDKYGDGDPYGDEEYVKNFRLIVKAIREGVPLQLTAASRYGRENSGICYPLRLEYSEKDDKFRLIAGGSRYLSTVNLAKITSCSICDGKVSVKPYRQETEHRTVTLRVTNDRNALERCMLHFAHFEKQAERIDSKTYLLNVKYDASDESELVIRVLSFGPHVEVTAPESFRALIIKKLKAQLECDLM